MGQKNLGGGELNPRGLKRALQITGTQICLCDFFYSIVLKQAPLLPLDCCKNWWLSCWTLLWSQNVGTVEDMGRDERY